MSNIEKLHKVRAQIEALQETETFLENDLLHFGEHEYVHKISDFDWRFTSVDGGELHIYYREIFVGGDGNVTFISSHKKYPGHSILVWFNAEEAREIRDFLTKLIDRMEGSENKEAV